MVQFVAVTLLTIYNSYLSDWQFLTSDLFIIFPLAYFISKTGAYDKLTRHQPTGDLISFPIIFSIFVQTAIVFIFQFGGRYFTMKVYKYYNYGEYADCSSEPLEPCYDNTVLFSISNAQYLLTAVAFSMSKPFRKPIYTNPLLTIFIMLTITLSLYIVVNNDWITNEYLYLIPFDGDDFYKYYIIAIIVLNLAIAYFTEAVIVPFFKKKWNDRQLRKMAKKISKAESEYNLNMINEVKNFAKEREKKNSKEPSETESMKNE